MEDILQLAGDLSREVKVKIAPFVDNIVMITIKEKQIGKSLSDDALEELRNFKKQNIEYLNSILESI